MVIHSVIALQLGYGGEQTGVFLDDPNGMEVGGVLSPADGMLPGRLVASPAPRMVVYGVIALGVWVHRTAVFLDDPNSMEVGCIVPSIQPTSPRRAHVRNGGGAVLGPMKVEAVWVRVCGVARTDGRRAMARSAGIMIWDLDGGT
ncbi:hypothetical protein HDU96_004813 [Phlyctochytrium bullatum]|nr:hypothetical protein HDU96_004813 [Phlyctochytrium bullatum]